MLLSKSSQSALVCRYHEITKAEAPGSLTAVSCLL